MGLNKAKIITVTSVKGGVGKSVFVMNLAGVCSNKKIKTLIIDLDLSFGVIAPSLNVPSSENVFTLTEDMMNSRMREIDNYISKYNDYIDVLPASNDPRDKSKIHFQYIENLIKQLSFKYEFIIIDTSHIMDEVSSIAFDNSDLVLYLMTDDLMNIKSMKSVLSIYSDLNIDNYKIVLNEVFKRNYTDLEFKTILGVEASYVLPGTYYIENIQKLIQDGKIYSIEKNKKISILEKIIEDILI